jgi:DDE family transposase
VLDESHYEKGLSISEEEMQKLRLRKHEQDPQWNYTLSPRRKVKSKK